MATIVGSLMTLKTLKKERMKRNHRSRGSVNNLLNMGIVSLGILASSSMKLQQIKVKEDMETIKRK